MSIEQAAATGMRKGAADVAFRVNSVGGGATNSARVGVLDVGDNAVVRAGVAVLPVDRDPVADVDGIAIV